MRHSCRRTFFTTLSNFLNIQARSHAIFVALFTEPVTVRNSRTTARDDQSVTVEQT
jgi:hypothetical protein